MVADTPFFALENVSKRYGGVHALRDVDFACSRGSIHAVLGENGAGKSTLMKIMAGVVQPDESRPVFEGIPVPFPNPSAANRAGDGGTFLELPPLPQRTRGGNITPPRPPP